MSFTKLIEKIGIDEYHPTEEKFLKELLVLLKNSFKVWTADKMANVLILRFGLNGNSPHTLIKIGDMYGLSRERIRQIEAKSLRMIRRRIRVKLYYY